MRLIISPAKKMRVDTDSYEVLGKPEFLEQAEILRKEIKKLTLEEARELWNCNFKLARLNYDRFQNMELTKALTPAIMAYEGLQYQHMMPGVFTAEALSYIGEHLRILSGFYGILKPFDGVVPYRLEMRAKLSAGGARNLYEFWGSLLYEQVYARMPGREEAGTVINLASKEYSRCIEKYLTPKDQFLTVEFGELSGGRVKQKGTLAKMARGEMVRFLAENQVCSPEGLKDFCGLGFAFSKEQSDSHHYVFLHT